MTTCSIGNESDQQAKTDEPTFAKQEVKERQDTRILAKRGVEVKDTESQDSTTPAEHWAKEKEREGARRASIYDEGPSER